MALAGKRIVADNEVVALDDLHRGVLGYEAARERVVARCRLRLGSAAA